MAFTQTAPAFVALSRRLLYLDLYHAGGAYMAYRYTATNCVDNFRHAGGRPLSCICGLSVS